MIAALVLNYRTADLTIAAVRSLQASTLPPDSIVVVDNASNDGSVERLRAIAGITLVSADTNGGFSSGCNLGITQALREGADRVLLLNSDVTVDADMLEQLAAEMDRHPGCGIVGPVLISNAGQVESAGIRYWPRSGRIRHEAYGRQPGEIRDPAVMTVDGINGCAMLISRVVFEQIGVLAEEFFFGFEDLEFCLRAKRFGFVTRCVRTAFAEHQGSASIGRRSPSRFYFGARNQLLLGARTGHGSGVAAAIRVWSTVGLNVAHALRQTEVPRVPAVRAVVRGTTDHFRGRYGRGPGV